MSTSTNEMHATLSTSRRYEIATADVSAPLGWLSKGLEDFRSAPLLSLLYGCLFAGLVAGLYLLANSAPWYSIGLLTGLMVAGPFLASGLYVASRDREAGRHPRIDSSIRLMLSRGTHLALFSLLLALIMAAWVRFSALLFALKFSTLSPSVEAYTAILSSSDGWITLGYFGAIGFLLAATVFAISAVAIPLILDKDVNFVTAISTSYRAVTGNLATMTVWAAIIVMLTAIGIGTAFIGLALLFPLLGYATWHSYRDLVT